MKEIKTDVTAQLSNDHCGFLLTRKAHDTANGLVLTFWLKTAKGPVKLIIDNEKAIFFVESRFLAKVLDLFGLHHIQLHHQADLPLKTFNQQAVTALYFNYLKDFYAARTLLKEHAIKCYEDDIRPEERYLMERFITSSLSFFPDEKGHANHHLTLKDGQEVQEASNKPSLRSYVQFNGVKCKAAKYDAALVVTSIDLECSPTGELYSIAAYSDDCQRVFMIGQKIKNCPEYLHWVNDEKDLLYTFIDWLNTYDPDVVIGWNVINFDFSLLQKRCERLQVPFEIGRDGRAPYWRHLTTSEQKFIDVAGRVILDGIDVLKTATYNFSSFSLENVSNELLGKSKKVSNVDNRLAEIIHNFHHDKLALAAYNLEDCALVWQIFEKTNLLSFAKLRAYLTGLTMDRVGGSVAAFTNLYLPKLHRAGYIAPNLGDGQSDLISPGGFVMDSIPGLYKNVLVLDFKSLYPSIIKTFHIDPMGLIEGLAHPDDAIAGFDGAYFSREKHFLPSIINELWLERDKAKAEKNSALSQAIKIIMNSFYGVLGSTGCRFYDPRLSGSITKRSHSILKTTKLWIEKLGHQVIYGDTDSIFVYVGDEHNEKSCLALGHDLANYINQQWQVNIENEHQVKSQLEIEFETHFTRFFMPSIRGTEVVKGNVNVGTKKRYAGLTRGVIQFKGLETVRSDWTDISKMFQQELYRRIFNELPVKEYIVSLVDEIRSGQHDSSLIYRKKIRRNLEDYVNTPPHIKACLIGNQALAKEGKKPKYKRGSHIEYVITLTGVSPVNLAKGALDYDYYIDKQIKPIANDILPFIDENFNEIVSNQLGLF